MLEAKLSHIEFTYISILNQVSGRTPSDATQYPVFRTFYTRQLVNYKHNTVLPHTTITMSNSFTNATSLYNHSEPILSYPPPGSCSLLTGNAKENITAGIYQPCCTNATAVTYERSECVCALDEGCETCIFQNREDFKLIAAVCNKDANGAGSLRVLGLSVLALAIAPSILQVLHMTM